MTKHYLYLTLFILFSLSGCNSNPTYNTQAPSPSYTPDVTPDVMIMNNNLDALKQHVQGMQNINSLDQTQLSLLHKAVIFDKPDAAELLLSSGANVNIKGISGVTPLFYTKSPAIYQTLKKYRVNVHALADNGLNALAFIKNAEIIEQLVKDGADPKRKSIQGQTALSISLFTLKSYEQQAAKNGLSDYQKDLFDLQLIPMLKKKIAALNKFSSLPSTPKIIRLAKEGNLNGVKQQAKKINLNTSVDYYGNTALHAAAQSNQLAVVKFLSQYKKLLSTKNNADQTPLDSVIKSKSASAKYLSCKINQFCKTPKSFALKINKACSATANMKSCERMLQQDVHGLFTSADIENRAKNIRFNSFCKRFNYIKCKQLQAATNDPVYAQKIENTLQRHSPVINRKFSADCGKSGSKSKCLHFAKTFPGFIPKANIEQAMIFHNQRCKTKEAGWIYKGKQCKNGFAHGRGEAVNTEKQLSYIGQFSQGQRTNGKILYKGTPMYDGSLENGKPNGKGVCFHEGEPEECKFYHGKRIDSLYKQRIEMAKQQKLMDEKLEKMQAAQNQQIKQMQQRMVPTYQGKSAAGNIGDVLIDKAMDKAIDKVFDSLF